jgi:hypothetical protein
MNASTLILQFKDQIERRWGDRLSPDSASEWEEKIAPGEEVFSDCPVPQSALKKGLTWGQRLLRGVSNLLRSIQETRCQSEAQFFNICWRKNLRGR